MIKFYTFTLLLLMLGFSYYALVVRKIPGASVMTTELYVLNKPTEKDWYECADLCMSKQSSIEEFSWTPEEDLYIVTCKCKNTEDLWEK